LKKAAEKVDGERITIERARARRLRELREADSTADFKPSEHPRGRKGEFIRTFADLSKTLKQYTPDTKLSPGDKLIRPSREFEANGVSHVSDAEALHVVGIDEKGKVIVKEESAGKVQGNRNRAPATRRYTPKSPILGGRFHEPVGQSHKSSWETSTANPVKTANELGRYEAKVYATNKAEADAIAAALPGFKFENRPKTREGEERILIFNVDTRRTGVTGDRNEAGEKRAKKFEKKLKEMGFKFADGHFKFE
jgi:hypothetical protein